MLIGGAVVFRRAKNGRVDWFLVQEDEKGWEIPKAIVRKGESSVRAVLRAMGEQGGMSCRVLDEVGRIEDDVEINGKKTQRKIIYYLVLGRTGGEVLGFDNSAWIDFSSALRRVSWEKEKMILKQAKVEFEKWLARQKK
ncbi:MAG: hypothetical protein KatS3mg088_106 [Patescibacteria group bacterium]|nr:MAG: hypothetical protein KatS3mg088_106 [Patescibacteria group bacterium]